jgi:hypothetical protein
MTLCQQYFGTIGSMTDDRIAEYRTKLLAVLAHLDQLATHAEAILADPADTDILPMADELRELLNDMRAKVEEKIDSLSQ